MVSFEDAALRSERLIYLQDRQVVVSDGPLELTQGIQWLRGSSGEFNLAEGTGVIRDADGYTDEELFVKAKVLYKTGPDTFEAEDGLLTACDEAFPKWSFRINKATIRVDSRTTLRHTVLKIKKIPVFYFPYILIPAGQKERSSGFLIPSTGNSNNKGRRVTQALYLVLGRSADLEVRADYFSDRGLAQGFTFRARPNNQSFLYLDAYGINDRLDQGGASLNGTGETRFGDGYRLVADFNLASNFTFRRVFSDSFFAATRPTEDSRLFLTNNFGSSSFNFRLARAETVFPGRNAVIRNGPAFNFKISGNRLGGTPFYYDLETTAEGVSRVDSRIETPGLSQRLDLHPQLYFSLPLFQGLRLSPRLAVRETFYSDSLRIDEEGNAEVGSDNFNRRYFDLRLDLKGWGLSRVYERQEGSWKHLIEPQVRYRWTHGIEDFDQIIRYDEEDAIANTNEVEYSLVNRIFVKRRSRQGSFTHEWLSLRVGQKYFIDPDFDGAWQLGRFNQFFPLNTLTGFPYGGLRRRFSPLTSVARFNPSRGTSFDMRGDFDLEFNRFRNFSLTGFYYKPRFSVATTYFLTQRLEPGTFENNQLQSQIRYGNLQRGLSASTVFSYDAREKRFLNSRSRVNYFWDCCGVSVEFQRLNVGLRREREIRFSFFLKGIGAFGTIRRPDRIF